MTISCDVAESIAVIRIDRPERLNALDEDHYAALSDAWVRVRDDPQIRCAVVTGAGDRSFCVGADLKGFIGRRQDAQALWLTQRGQLLNRGLEVWKPVIAAVNGYCLGGGLTMLLATDIRIAVPGATFGLSEVKRGLIPANGGTQRLLAQLPHAIGMELLLTGDPIDAEAALRWGLVNRVVDRGALMDTALACARRIAANAPLAVQAAKELALRARHTELATGLRMEQLAQRMLVDTDDAREGRQAFAEKRPPVFRGQ